MGLGGETKCVGKSFGSLFLGGRVVHIGVPMARRYAPIGAYRNM